MKRPPTDTPFNPRLRFDDGEAYEQMMGRWSALVAGPFLDWLAMPQGLEWLDDGCGNGSFTELLVVRQRPVSVVGIDPSPAQLAFARQRPGSADVSFVEGDAEALPLTDASVDVAVMALVLFFLPSPPRGLQEMVRAVRPGGMVAANHWDMAGGGFPLQPVLDAVRAEGYKSQEPPSTWASALDALIAGRHQAGSSTSSERQVLNANTDVGSWSSRSPRAISPTCRRSAGRIGIAAMAVTRTCWPERQRSGPSADVRRRVTP